jgi:hypothetical protein
LAGEWIKVEIGLPEKPEVMRLARILNISRPQVVGEVFKFWVWADKNTVDGVVDGVEASDIDDVMSVPGFAQALSDVGWLTIDAQRRRVVIPNFERHNGESAKKRALKNERQSRWRANATSTQASTSASTREEKRREEVKPIAPSGAFLKFWTLWPNVERKQARGKCWEVWLKKDFDQEAETILTHVESLKSSESWRSGYVPAPLTYLNQRRWEGAGDSDSKIKLDIP